MFFGFCSKTLVFLTFSWALLQDDNDDGDDGDGSVLLLLSKSGHSGGGDHLYERRRIFVM